MINVTHFDGESDPYIGLPGATSVLNVQTALDHLIHGSIQFCVIVNSPHSKNSIACRMEHITMERENERERESVLTGERGVAVCPVPP